MIPACLSLMRYFNRGNIEGANFENLCLMSVYFVFCFIFVQGLVLWIDLRIFFFFCMRRVLNVHLLKHSFCLYHCCFVHFMSASVAYFFWTFFFIFKLYLKLC